MTDESFMKIPLREVNAIRRYLAEIRKTSAYPNSVGDAHRAAFRITQILDQASWTYHSSGGKAK